MSKDLVDIRIHGVLAKKVGKKSWSLSVSSVREALHAVNCLTSSKLFKSINSLSQKNVKYVVKVNNEIQQVTKEGNPLLLERNNLRSIDN